MSLKFCPDYDTRFVRDRSLWLFVILLQAYGLLTLLADPLEIERYIYPKDYEPAAMILNRDVSDGPFQIMLPSTAASSFLVFTFYLYWAGTALLPVKGAWRVTFVCLLFGLGGHVLSLRNSVLLQGILEEGTMARAGLPPTYPTLEIYLQALILINTINVAVSLVLLGWWWQRGSMYRYDFGDEEPEQKHDGPRMAAGEQLHQMNRYH